MNDAWVQPFLNSLRQLGKKAPAARAVGVSVAAVYDRVKQDADFAAAVEDAINECADSMEVEMVRRGRDGINKPVIYQGELQYLTEPALDDDGMIQRDKDGNVKQKLVYDQHGKPIPLTVNERSDALLMFGLKGYRKKVFAERTEVTGADGTPLEPPLTDTERAARVAAILDVARQRQQAAENDIT